VATFKTATIVSPRSRVFRTKGMWRLGLGLLWSAMSSGVALRTEGPSTITGRGKGLLHSLFVTESASHTLVHGTNDSWLAGYDQGL